MTSLETTLQRLPDHLVNLILSYLDPLELADLASVNYLQPHMDNLSNYILQQKNPSTPINISGSKCTVYGLRPSDALPSSLTHLSASVTPGTSYTFDLSHFPLVLVHLVPLTCQRDLQNLTNFTFPLSLRELHLNSYNVEVSQLAALPELCSLSLRACVVDRDLDLAAKISSLLVVATNVRAPCIANLKTLEWEDPGERKTMSSEVQSILPDKSAQKLTNTLKDTLKNTSTNTLENTSTNTLENTSANTSINNNLRDSIRSDTNFPSSYLYNLNPESPCAPFLQKLILINSPALSIDLTHTSIVHLELLESRIASTDDIMFPPNLHTLSLGSKEINRVENNHTLAKKNHTPLGAKKNHTVLGAKKNHTLLGAKKYHTLFGSKLIVNHIPKTVTTLTLTNVHISRTQDLPLLSKLTCSQWDFIAPSLRKVRTVPEIVPFLPSYISHLEIMGKGSVPKMFLQLVHFKSDDVEYWRLGEVEVYKEWTR